MRHFAGRFLPNDPARAIADPPTSVRCDKRITQTARSTLLADQVNPKPAPDLIYEDTGAAPLVYFDR